MKSNPIISRTYLNELKLNQKWPSQKVISLFRDLFSAYTDVAREDKNIKYSKHEVRFESLQNSFSQFCSSLEICCCKGFRPVSGSPFSKQVSLKLKDLYDYHGDDFVQVLSSLLGMLLHVDPLSGKGKKITNYRRPQKEWSTYPNSPGLSRLMADNILLQLLKIDDIDNINNIGTLPDIRKISNSFLNFKILDPSMESGQLLLGIALSWKQFIFSRFEPGSPSAKMFLQTGWSKLCRDVLWGNDRNPLAIIATKTLFRILFKIHHLRSQSPKNLTISDTLKDRKINKPDSFDAIINNPPWGEKIKSEERQNIRKKYICANPNCDTYLAFMEHSLRILKKNGIFTFCIPAQSIASKKALIFRKYLASKANINLLFLLPGEVFSDASIRSIVISGKRNHERSREKCLVINSKPSAKKNNDNKLNIRSVSQNQLLKFDDSWFPFFSSKNKFRDTSNLIQLADIATLSTGKRIILDNLYKSDIKHTASQCRRFFRGNNPFGYLPALKGTNIGKYQIKDVIYYMNENDDRILSSKTDMKSTLKIFLREFIKPSGDLSAAVVDFKSIPLRGVVSIIPHNIDPYLLAAILNSSQIAKFVKYHAVSLTKPQFHTILLSEVKNIPIPKFCLDFALGNYEKNTTGLRLSNLCTNIIELSKKISRKTKISPQSNIVFEKLDKLVSSLFESHI